MGNYPENWCTTRLTTFLKKVRRPVAVEPQTLYRQIGARSFGKGIFHKEPVTGEDLGDKGVFWVRPGDFVLNIVFAWEGAVALISEAEEGMCASHRFPTFIIDDTICDPAFLLLYFKTKKGVEQLALASPGGAGRNRTLNQADFLNLIITLPSLPEQRKIADILNTWDKAIATVRQLTVESQKYKKELMRGLLSSQLRLPAFEGKEWEDVRIEDVAEVNPRRQNGLAEDYEVSFVSMSSVSENGKVIRSQVRLFGEVNKGYTPFKNRDVLIAKITPCLENGKGALLENLCNGIGFGSTEFHVVRADTTKVLPEFLFYHTVSDQFRKTAEQNMVGSAGQRRLQPNFVSKYKIGVPKLAEQADISNILKAVDDYIDHLGHYLNRLQQQKQGLMQRLLTGQVRVRVDEEEG